MLETDLKIAVVGPLGAGKRTCLEVFRPWASLRGKCHWPDRVEHAIRHGAHFLDFLPPSAAYLHGRLIRFHLYTSVEPDGDAALALALDGAHAVLFVADSTRRDANVAARARAHTTLPIAFLFNKRDVAGAASVDDLARDLNVGDAPVVEGIATQAQGVQTAVVAAARISTLMAKAKPA